MSWDGSRITKIFRRERYGRRKQQSAGKAFYYTFNIYTVNIVSVNLQRDWSVFALRKAREKRSPTQVIHAGGRPPGGERAAQKGGRRRGSRPPPSWVF
jgi:hypothetical protein